MNSLPINKVKKEVSWLIPIRVPKQKINSGSKKPRASKVRYAIVGLGYIAQIAVLPAFRHAHENSELVALVSGGQEKRKKLATKYKVNKTKIFASVESRSMLIGAAAFFIYALVCCRLMIRQRFRATPVAIIALVPWLVVALGGWTLLLRSWR
jgi:hypothetical protein